MQSCYSLLCAAHGCQYGGCIRPQDAVGSTFADYCRFHKCTDPSCHDIFTNVESVQFVINDNLVKFLMETIPGATYFVLHKCDVDDCSEKAQEKENIFTGLSMLSACCRKHTCSRHQCLGQIAGQEPDSKYCGPHTCRVDGRWYETRGARGKGDLCYLHVVERAVQEMAAQGRLTATRERWNQSIHWLPANKQISWQIGLNSF